MGQPKNLLSATKEERHRFIDSFDYILTDCDGNVMICLNWLERVLAYILLFKGTVWDLVGPFEGASGAVDNLKDIGKRVVYVSNNSSRTEEEYDDRFRKFNFNANFVSNNFKEIIFLYLKFPI